MPRREEKLTREEAEKVLDEMADLTGDKLKNHRDGDAERLLFKMYPRRSRARTKT